MAEQVRIKVGDDKRIEFVEGDLTRETTDAIVNAANSSLMGGGGVDGAIHRAGGPEIREQCRKVRETQHPQGLPTGQAVATTAGRMPSKYVIHTVGPIWNGGNSGERELLESCYRQSIALADKLNLGSIAFPSISTGAFGYPVQKAAHAAVAAAVDALRAAKHVKTVRFVLFGARDFQVYSTEAQEITQ